MKVRLCEKNKGKSKVARRLAEELPELDVKMKKCIDVCDDCARGGSPASTGKRSSPKTERNSSKKSSKNLTGSDHRHQTRS